MLTDKSKRTQNSSSIGYSKSMKTFCLKMRNIMGWAEASAALHEAVGPARWSQVDDFDCSWPPGSTGCAGGRGKF